LSANSVGVFVLRNSGSPEHHSSRTHTKRRMQVSNPSVQEAMQLDIAASIAAHRKQDLGDKELKRKIANMAGRPYE